MLAFERLTSTDYLTMPWKNGKGTTLELSVHPPRVVEGLSDFDWRLSIARVVEDGPFSRFPGIERVIMILEGEAMTLQCGKDAEARTLRPLEPLAFSGDALTQAQLPQGPVQDFNLMVKRAGQAGRLTVISAEPEQPVSLRSAQTPQAEASTLSARWTPLAGGGLAVPSLRFLYCVSGSALVTLSPKTDDNEEPSVAPSDILLTGGYSSMLQPGESLRRVDQSSAPVQLRIQAIQETVLIAVEIADVVGHETDARK